MIKVDFSKLNALVLSITYFLLLSIFNNIYIIIVTAIIQILMIMINAEVNYSKFSNINSKHFLFLLIIFIISILFCLMYGDFYLKINTTILVFSQIFILLFLIESMNEKKLFFEKFCSIFIKISVFLVLYSMFVYFFGNSYMSYNRSLRMFTQNCNVFGINLYQSAIGGDIVGTYNVGSLLSNPNGLSYTCLLASIMLLYFFKQKKKFTQFISIIFLSSGLLLSGSRLALILFIGIIPLNICISILKGKTIFKYLILFIGVFCVVFIIYNIKGIIKNINFNGRLELWEIGIKNIKLLGQGLNADNLLIQSNLNTTIAMHNAYITTAVDFGLIFLGGFIIYIVFFVKKLINLSKRDSIYHLILLLTIVLLVFSLSEYTFFSFSSYNIIFFLIIFLTNSNIKEVNSND